MSIILQALAKERWLVEPGYLQTMADIASREHDVETLASKVGKPLENTRNTEIRGDVAIVYVVGAIYRYANLFTEVCGAVSTERLAKELRTVSEDRKVKTIVLHLDCPGGQAAGIWELSQMIRGIDKTVIAYVDDTAASGGYWIASACDHIAASKTAMVGSIGAVYTFKLLDDGEKKIEIVSSVSPKKRFDVSTKEGAAQVQTWADDLGEIFVEDVARFRGVSKAKVLENFGAGDMLIAERAKRVKMIDEITTFEQMLF